MLRIRRKKKATKNTTVTLFNLQELQENSFHFFKIQTSDTISSPRFYIDMNIYSETDSYHPKITIFRMFSCFQLVLSLYIKFLSTKHCSYIPSQAETSYLLNLLFPSIILPDGGSRRQKKFLPSVWGSITCQVEGAHILQKNAEVFGSFQFLQIYVSHSVQM